MFPEETWSCGSEEGTISESVICYNFHVVGFGWGGVATSTLISQGCSVIFVVMDSAILNLNIICDLKKNFLLSFLEIQHSSKFNKMNSSISNML